MKGKKSTRLRNLSLALALAAALALCISAVVIARADSRQELQVFAASVLAETMGEMERAFEKAHPGTDVKLSLASSSVLRTQVENGARPDVFASADLANMAPLQKAGFIDGKFLPLAHNRLVVVVPSTNRAHINALQDLTRPNLTVVACPPETPIGNYTLQALDKLQKSGRYGADYRKRVEANFRSLEPNVKSALVKVALGDADAGFCYLSDVTPGFAKEVKVIPIPDKYNVEATCYIGVIRGTHHIGQAREFVKMVLSPAGQAILKRHGMVPTKARRAPKTRLGESA